jgi:hypothetical protein
MDIVDHTLGDMPGFPKTSPSPDAELHPSVSTTVTDPVPSFRR